MSMKYLKAYYDWVTVMEPLSDAERGRLMTAALIYAGTGELIPLEGAEKYVFPTIRLQIDRDRDNYREVGAKRSAAGRLGGRPTEKQPKANQPNAFYEKQTKAPQSKKSQDKDEDQDKDHSAAVAADAHNGGNGLLTDEEMDALAEDLNDVLNAAERAGFPQTPADCDLGTSLVAEYGAQPVLSAIGVAVSRNVEKRHWGYVRGILARDPTGQGFAAREPDESVKPKFIDRGGAP